jgi:hypothetical protein
MPNEGRKIWSIMYPKWPVLHKHFVEGVKMFLYNSNAADLKVKNSNKFSFYKMASILPPLWQWEEGVSALLVPNVEPLLVLSSAWQQTHVELTYFSSSKNRSMFLRCFYVNKQYTKCCIVIIHYLTKEKKK